MIFQPELIEKIVAGKETETRRPVKPGERECRYRAGQCYSVQPGRGERGVGRIEVLSVRKELLGEITEEGARREGFASVRDFAAYWLRLYGTFSGRRRRCG